MQVALDNPLHVNLAARDRSNFAHSGLYLTTRNGTGQFNILYRIRSNSSAAMNILSHCYDMLTSSIASRAIKTVFVSSLDSTGHTQAL